MPAVVMPGWKQWVWALVALVAATAANFFLQPAVEGKLPWLLYFPALVFTALYAGLWPSILVLVGALLVGMTYWMEPYGTLWPLSREADLISAAMFVLGGATVAAVSAWTRQLLRTSRNDKLRLDLALSTGHMVGWNWDLPSGAVSFSANASDLFGASWSSMEESFRLVHPEDRDRIRIIIDEALRAGTVYSFLSRMYRPDNRELLWLQTRGHVHRTEDGQALHVSGVTADVTELVLAQEQLRVESRRKDAFLATLAHELRNPLAPIRYAAAMLREDATPAQRQKARDVIARQSGHMARLLDDLLDMSRVTRDVIELEPVVFDLLTAIEHAADNARGSFAQRQHRLTLDLPEHPLFFRGDLTRIQQVLGNLLDNAAKYTPDEGSVAVRLRREGKSAVITVTDNGIGIARDRLPEVFELFTQLHEPGRSAGLGIGLAIVKRLVELHGGTISADSAGPGQGSEFTVRLPLTSDHHAAGDLDQPASMRSVASGEHVLVVDDNADTADSLAAILRKCGFLVSVAYDGTSAMRLYDQYSPSAVLLDMGLPDVSGAVVAQHVRAAARDTVLIAVTGWDEQQAAGLDSFDVHLVKPVDPDKLLRQLAQMLDRDTA